MPRGDCTGPSGFGPMTGRSLGYCAGYSSPDFIWSSGWGRGCGWGRGFGRGRRFSPYFPIAQAPVFPSPIYGVGANLSPEAQLNMFKQEKQYLESELENIKSALDDITKSIQKLEQNN